MSKKILFPLSENQTVVGPSNAAPKDVLNGKSLIPKASGFAFVGNSDFVNVDITSTGSSVDMKFSIQSVDYWNNVIDLHTGQLSAAGNVVIEVYPNSRELIRTNITEHNNGAFYSSVSAGSYDNR